MALMPICSPRAALVTQRHVYLSAIVDRPLCIANSNFSRSAGSSTHLFPIAYLQTQSGGMVFGNGVLTCDLLYDTSMTDVIYSLCAGQTIRLTLPLVTPNIFSDTNISITGSVKGEWRW